MDTQTERQTKKELRGPILARRKAMSTDEVDSLSRIICGKIQQMDVYREADDICLYMPIRNEVDVTGLIGPARRQGKKVWIPLVTGETMVFNAYEEDKMGEEGAFHIPESSSEEILSPSENTLIIMPGSVFDVHGNRIGYGGGYYDRYLQQYPFCRTAAVCYDFQIVDQLPAEEHDRKPELIVSECRVFRQEDIA